MRRKRLNDERRVCGRDELQAGKGIPQIVDDRALHAVVDGVGVAVQLHELEHELADRAVGRADFQRNEPLVGIGGDRVLLSSPIILGDHPEIAPESPGDLYDSTEIDEILTLRTMTLTDAEKAMLDLQGPVLRVTGYDVPYPYWQIEVSNPIGDEWWRGSVALGVEAAFLGITEPTGAYGVGVTPKLIYTLTTFGQLKPYVEGGGGPLWTNFDGRLHIGRRTS